jgi:hypothetical protein
MLSYVSASSGQSSTAVNSFTVPWPAGLAANDIVLLAVNIGGLSTLTDPAGFTAITNLDESTTLRSKAWWYRATGSESGSITVAWTGTAQLGAAAAVAYRGCLATATPIHSASNVTGAVAAGTSRVNTAWTGTFTGPVWEFMFWADVNTTGTSSWNPAGMGNAFAERADVATTATPFLSVSAVDGPGSNANPGATRTNVSAVSGTAWVGYHIGLLPAPASAVAGGGARALTETGVALRAAAGFGQPGFPSSSSWPAAGQGWPRIRQG